MGEEILTRPFTVKTPSTRIRSYSGKSSHSFKIDGNSAYDHSLKLQNWISDKALTAIQRVADEEVREVHLSIDPIFQREQTFDSEMKKLLYNKELCDLRKKEIKHLRWNKAVFEPLCNRIHSVMSENSGSNGYHKQNQRMSHNYIEYLNKRGTVSLDVYSLDEYNPFPLTYQPLRVQTAPAQLHPVHSIHDKNHPEEDLQLLRSISRETSNMSAKPAPSYVAQPRFGPENSIREMTWSRWNVMPLGFIDSNVRKRSRMRLGGNFNSGNIQHVMCNVASHQSMSSGSMRALHTVQCPKSTGEYN